MTVDLTKLKLIEIDDVAIIGNYFKNNRCMRSAFSPVNLFIWGTQYSAQYFFIDDKLIIYNKAWNCILLPCGILFSPNMLKQISDTFYDSGRCGRVSFLDKEYIDKYKDQLDSFNIFVDRNNADYIYLAKNLAALSGKKLQKKKNLISQFKRLYPDYNVADLSVNDFEECLELSEKWMSNHHHQHPGYQFERKAFLLAFKYFDRLNLNGKKVYVDGRLVAFSLYSRLNDEMAQVHFEKFDREIKGSAQVVNWEMAKLISQKYLYINREEDLGIEQLRKSKLSYQPLVVLDSYILERVNKERRTDS